MSGSIDLLATQLLGILMGKPKVCRVYFKTQGWQLTKKKEFQILDFYLTEALGLVKQQLILTLLA